MIVRAILVGTLVGLAAVEGCGGHVAADPPAPRPSCASNKPGAGPNCGVDGKTDCCASVEIPGGTFNRLNDPRYPATVSTFRMGVFELTVGRLRAFVDAYPGSRPKPGDGAHPKVPGSGWNAEWDRWLPPTRAALVANVACFDAASKSHATWTAEPGPNEHMPASCVGWYEAFAFCAWDGGRLPTDAEWSYVASGGGEQRKYPWGSAPADVTRAVLQGTPTGWLTPVGSTPAGASRWGVLDLAGSRIEYVRDATNVALYKYAPPVPCVDCIDNSPEGLFILRDRHWNALPEMANVAESYAAVASHGSGTPADTVRCAWDVP